MKKLINLITEILESHLKLLTLDLQQFTEDSRLRQYYADIGKQLDMVTSQYATDSQELLVCSEYVAQFMHRYRSVSLFKKKMADERWKE